MARIKVNSLKALHSFDSESNDISVVMPKPVDTFDNFMNPPVESSEITKRDLILRRFRITEDFKSGRWTYNYLDNVCSYKEQLTEEGLINLIASEHSSLTACTACGDFDVCAEHCEKYEKIRSLICSVINSFSF